MGALVKQKPCFKCGETFPLSEFYAHPMMADGHLNKCKECTKKDVRADNAKTREARSEYERQRYQRPERKAQIRRYAEERMARDPERDRARQMVGNALRDGRLKKSPCEVCGSTKHVEGHHDDYSKPLDVRWLCFKHHREHHGQVVVTTRYDD